MFYVACKYTPVLGYVNIGKTPVKFFLAMRSIGNKQRYKIGLGGNFISQNIIHSKNTFPSKLTVVRTRNKNNVPYINNKKISLYISLENFSLSQKKRRKTRRGRLLTHEMTSSEALQCVIVFIKIFIFSVSSHTLQCMYNPNIIQNRAIL